MLVENMDRKDREKFDNELSHAVNQMGTTDQDFIEDELAKRRARVAANRDAMSRTKG